MQKAFPMKTIDLRPSEYHLDRSERANHITTMLAEGSDAADIAAHVAAHVNHFVWLGIQAATRSVLPVA